MSGLRMVTSRLAVACLGALGVAVAVTPNAADAALPPQFQRVKEFRAILDDATIAKAFGAANPIDRIERTENAHYQVSSARCVMDVTLVSTDTKRSKPWYGAWSFAVKSGPLVCR